jgi:hypothetical protein
VLALASLFWIIEGVHAGILRDGSQCGGLGQRQIADGLAEVHTSRGLNAVSHSAVVVGVEIPLQDLLFAIFQCEAMSHQNLCDLALVVFSLWAFRTDDAIFGVVNDVLDQLLRD